MDIGEKLKQLREANGMTRKDVADKLKAFGIDISDKTLYGYESGRNSANADMFLALCQIYKCNNIMETFSSSVDNVLFTNDEWKMIEQYRLLDLSGQETVSAILKHECERVKELAQKDDRINELEAKPIIIEKHDDTMMRIYTYLRKIACAGNGFYFDDIPTETIEAPYLEGAEFIVGVNGDSMEPTYKDGDLVYVEKRQIIETGEIGIFIINNECFIKEAGEEGLISHNPKYPMIPGTENIQCIGKVLAKIPVLDN